MEKVITIAARPETVFRLLTDPHEWVRWKVVFTWGWQGSPTVPPGSSTVEIDLEPDGDGTRLRLVHRGLPEAALASHTEGWDYFLPRLVSVAEGRVVESDTAHHTTAQTQR
ncbi:MAG: SRPBCC domain-containing protein [Chloroflexi bacterium]|nr:MAG: SRPBCC domain-containing protein [Chloroflexota bacterium]